jgi:hypothetical protein
MGMEIVTPENSDRMTDKFNRNAYLSGPPL